MDRFLLEKPVAQSLVQANSGCTSVAREQLKTLGGPERSLDPVHQLRTNSLTAASGMNNETTDMAGLAILVTAHRADDSALIDGFENHPAAELRPQCFECFG